MFERLNQPISFRRKPSAEDALETAAPAAQAPAPASAESQGRKRTSLFARLNQPDVGREDVRAGEKREQCVKHLLRRRLHDFGNDCYLPDACLLKFLLHLLTPILKH